MFKAIKDDKIIAINETDSFPCLVYDEVMEDTEHAVSDYEQVEGEYVLTTDDKAVELKKEQVRVVRNSYLEKTDKCMLIDFPLSDDEKDLYLKYRVYLRDYTRVEEWFEKNPLTFDEFCNSAKEADEEELSVLNESESEVI